MTKPDYICQIAWLCVRLTPKPNMAKSVSRQAKRHGPREILKNGRRISLLAINFDMGN
jgi:hypothetical protein